MSRRTKFTLAEDRDLLDFVDKHKSRYPPGGRKLWLFAESQRITTHSWQAMKSRWMLLTQGPKTKKTTITTKTKTAHSPRHPTQWRLPYTPTTNRLTGTETTTRPAATATATATMNATVTTTQATLTQTLRGRQHFTDAQTQTDATDTTNRTGSTDSEDWTDWTKWINWTEDAATQTETPLPRHRRSHSI